VTDGSAGSTGGAPATPPRTTVGDATAPTMSNLRGAGVSVDGRKIAHVVVGLVLVTLVALSCVFFVAGAHQNGQFDRIHADGVGVRVTVDGCLGSLGGSGSNAAGYICRGAFTLDGVRHDEIIPGSQLRLPHSTVRAIVVPDDPALLVTVAAAATDRASARVYILPAVLLACAIAFGAVIILRRRRTVVATSGV
jgi:hypothetical protein